jgi:uncharacterized membrane protein YdbT with pleckstrin-like domain
MCGGGPSQAEQQAAAEQRVEADLAKREAVEDRAKQKREDISSALSARVQRQGKRGGKGRRSLFTSSQGAAGYLQRFN